MTRSASDAALHAKAWKAWAREPSIGSGPFNYAYKRMKRCSDSDSSREAAGYFATGFVAGYLAATSAAQRAGKRGKNTKARAAPKGKR